MNKNYFFIQNRADFHKRRKTTIGSSDIPVLLGLAKQHKTQYELWKEMTGKPVKRVEIDTVKNETPAALGHEVEGIILAREIADIAGSEMAHAFKVDYYKHEHERPKDWRTATPFKPFAIFIHPDDKRFSCSPDVIIEAADWQESWCNVWVDQRRGMQIAYPNEKHDRIIESKLGSRFANIRSTRLEDGYDLDDPTQNGIPMRVYVQCQWQSFVTGIEHITVRALLDSVFESRHTFTANPQIQNQLAELAESFLWHVQKDKAPAPMNQNDVFDIYDSVDEQVLIIGGKQAKEAEELLFQKKQWTDAKKEAERNIEEIKNSFAVMMGDKRYLETATGTKIATQVIQKPRWFNIGIQRIHDNCPAAFSLLSEQGMIPEKKEVRSIR